ncbi:MAG: tRNA 2-thiouridine(34) synthase MnmA [Candidatus Gastranaerophilaceae bacterium]
MKIIVGMSGGVDSSVAALLLKQAGHDVVGVTMSIWNENNKIKGGNKNACYGPDEKEDIEEAKRICHEIGIPFHVFDCVEQYEKIVLENFKEEYLSGRTPNPCIWCNSLIKFDVLPFLARQSGIEFDKFATGHYARVEYNEENKRHILKKGINPKKDQSYFIYRLRQDQLANILLPLGGYMKEQIREIAKNNGLKVFDKPDSQDFYSGDYNELLEIKEQEGNIVDKSGNILGKHNGIWNYTIGQRKGIGVSSIQPLYVLKLDKEKNEVIIGTEDETLKKSLIAKKLNWISIENLKSEVEVKAKIRSAQSETEVIVKPVNNDEVYVEFINLQKSVTPGQSIVFYDGEIVLGGGIIDKVL